MRHAATLGLAVLVLASCSPVGGDDPPEAAVLAASSTLSATVSQNGRDVHARRIQIKVRQESGAPLRLGAISAVVPGFAAEPRRDLETSTRPGSGLDLPVPLGETDCAATSTGGSVMVTLTVTGLDQPVSLEAPDTNGALARLHSTECNAAAVTELVPMTWSEEWSPQGTGSSLVSTGSLRVGPVPAGHTATLVGVDSTVLFTPTVPQPPGPDPFPIDVGPEEVLELAISLSPTRCDAHAVSEGLPHRGFAFRVRIGVDGGEAATVTVQPPERARSVMLDSLLTRCGLG